jgi:hypothetical protein
MKYEAGMHMTGKKGGNFIPSTYKRTYGGTMNVGEKNPNKE